MPADPAPGLFSCASGRHEVVGTVAERDRRRSEKGIAGARRWILECRPGAAQSGGRSSRRAGPACAPNVGARCWQGWDHAGARRLESQRDAGLRGRSDRSAAAQPNPSPGAAAPPVRVDVRHREQPHQIRKPRRREPRALPARTASLQPSSELRRSEASPLDLQNATRHALRATVRAGREWKLGNESVGHG